MMIYFKAVGGRGVDNVKPVHRSPSVSVFCQCVLLVILAYQMQRTTPKSGDSVRGGGATGAVRNVYPNNVHPASHVSVVVFILYLVQFVNSVV